MTTEFSTQADIDRYGSGCVEAIGPMSRLLQDERIAAGRMTLGGFIDTLTSLGAEHPDMPIATSDGHTLTSPHSNRGYYVDLSFAPDYGRDSEQTVSELVNLAISCVSTEYPGWKGGTFRMNLNTPVWVAAHGDTGRYIAGVRVEDGKAVIDTASDCPEFDEEYDPEGYHPDFVEE